MDELEKVSTYDRVMSSTLLAFASMISTLPKSDFDVISPTVVKLLTLSSFWKMYKTSEVIHSAMLDFVTSIVTVQPSLLDPCMKQTAALTFR